MVVKVIDEVSLKSAHLILFVSFDLLILQLPYFFWLFMKQVWDLQVLLMGK